jgi:hypothetical protein
LNELGLLLLLGAFQIKHFLGDYVLQSRYILDHRRIWGHGGGLLHVAIHAALTLPILLVAHVSLPLLLAIMLGEAVFHYHLDWVKDGWTLRMGWTPRDKQFWWLNGVDQALHQISYLVIVWLISG